MPQDYSDDAEFDQLQELSSVDTDLPFLGVNFVQQVDELVSLAHYGPSLVIITGDDGIGKSCIAEQLEIETSDIGQIHIDGNPMLSVDQLHASFLSQLNNYDQQVEFNSVRDSLQLAAELTEQLIVVDDAEQLSTSVLESLISLISPLEQSPSIPVRLFLFGKNELNNQINKDSFPASAIYNLQLKGFDKDEVSPFVGHHLTISVAAVETRFGKKNIQRIWKTSNGNPAKIIESIENSVDEIETTEDSVDSTGQSKGIRILLTLLGITLLLLAIFGEGWLGLGNKLPAEEIEPQIAVIEIPAEDSVVKPDETAAVADKPAQDSSANSVIIEEKDHSLEVEQPTTEANIFIKDDSTGAELESPLVNVELKTAAEIENSTDSVVPDIAPVLAPAIDVVTESFVDEENLVAEPLLQSSQEQQAPLNYTDDEQQLLQQPMEHYAIQLVGLRDISDMQKYKQQLKLQQAVYIYASLLHEKTWFVLVTGSYETAEEARIARDLLQPSLKKLNPFIKSYNVIQQQIRQAAETKK